MFVTTYQHDYINPSTRRQQFLKAHAEKHPHLYDPNVIKEDKCVCIEETVVQPNAPFECAEPEWTGIAPMGRLLDPALLPKEASKDADELRPECVQMKPNRFLHVLRTLYPDLYLRLKEMPHDELQHKMDTDRLITSYQIDFCDSPEYPEEDEIMRKKKTHILSDPANPCDKFRRDVALELQNVANGKYLLTDPCQKMYKPFKMSFSDGAHFSSGGNKNSVDIIEFKKSPPISEYQDSISRIGCVITANKLHHNYKCAKGKACHHIIKNPCRNFIERPKNKKPKKVNYDCCRNYKQFDKMGKLDL